MYAFAALALMAAWYHVGHLHHASSGLAYMLLAGAMLSVAMHVLQLSRPAT